MEIENLEEKNLVIWKLHDELEEPSLLKQPMADFKASEGRTMLLDLSEKEWLSSSEIGVVMWIFKELEGSGSDLCLLAVSPFVEKTIKVTGIDQLLPVYGSREEAFEEISSQA